MKTRDQATDRHGLPLAPGLVVRVLDAARQLEATIVRVLGDYGVVTVLVEDRNGRTERMYPTDGVELLVPARVPVRARQDVA
ncbi:MAG: hypothetical protein E6G99_09290 [Bacillati bacterium ANGP1]|uniref:DUF4926 domain-containing protein n=1 Tax=Candidatus Segetimicrobium genomatis TaxID=2569760 RepID=A0A537LLF0_9BACT|nr:MAG: hypothetical protein E6G99_09290 [Terrabacteria group bacterium ANGP1]TMJ08845.1 MAG: hypothetical protein E6G98_11205 [Terrabacteria group bacterium ANGP1]